MNDNDPLITPVSGGRRPLGRHGLQVGPLACGGAQLGNLGREVAEEEWAGVIPAARACGVRYFDVAPHYGLGLAERRLGRSLRDLPRTDLLVSTKVGRLIRPANHLSQGRDDEGFAVSADAVRVRDYSRDGIRRSLEASLTRLGLDRVDIVYVHDPDEHYREALDQSLPALEELRNEKVITSYGAGMNQSAMLTRFVEQTDLDVVMVAGRYTLLEQGALDDLLPACQARGVSVAAAGVFNSGILATDTAGPTDTYNYAPADAHVLERVDRLAAVCHRHHVPLPAAAAQFPLGHPAVSTVCLGAYSGEQMRRNHSLFNVEIPEAFWTDLRDKNLLRHDAPTPPQRKSLA